MKRSPSPPSFATVVVAGSIDPDSYFQQNKFKWTICWYTAQRARLSYVTALSILQTELYLHSIHLISAIGEEHLVGVGGGVVLPGAAHRPQQYDQDCVPPESLLTLSRVSSRRRVSI